MIEHYTSYERIKVMEIIKLMKQEWVNSKIGSVRSTKIFINPLPD